MSQRVTTCTNRVLHCRYQENCQDSITDTASDGLDKQMNLDSPELLIGYGCLPDGWPIPGSTRKIDTFKLVLPKPKMQHC